MFVIGHYCKPAITNNRDYRALAFTSCVALDGTGRVGMGVSTGVGVGVGVANETCRSIIPFGRVVEAVLTASPLL
jgi:hypothetical protein